MTGTIINVAAIVAGGFGGLAFGKVLTKNRQDMLMQVLGLCTMFLGIGGTMQEMLVINSDGLATQGTMMIIGCLVAGALIGDVLDIEGGLEHFGDWLREKTHSGGDGTFTEGFVSTSLIVCVGAMAIVGAIKDGLSGDMSVLLAKAVLDCVLVMIMTSAYGIGCIFSAIPVFILQGGVSLLARVVRPFMTEAALSNISLIGSMMIFCVGVNIIRHRQFKVANMLPALILAVIWAFMPWA